MTDISDENLYASGASNQSRDSLVAYLTEIGKYNNGRNNYISSQRSLSVMFNEIFNLAHMNDKYPILTKMPVAMDNKYCVCPTSYLTQEMARCDRRGREGETTGNLDESNGPSCAERKEERREVLDLWYR